MTSTTMTRPSRTPTQVPSLAGKRVLVTGASGLVGSRLLGALARAGAVTSTLVRRAPLAPREFQWDPASGRIDLADGAFDAVVHLAGENIAGGRWTAARKEEIRRSRVEGTRLLAEALARMETPPKVLVSASAIGFYGDRGEQALGEDAGPGAGFLPEVCEAWERAADPARERGIRVVHPRIGIVLAAEGGALARMLTPFRLGAGGKLGCGCQYMSWITRNDLVRVLVRSIEDDSLQGPVNATAPAPATNLEFTKALGRALRRPTIAPMPAFAAKLLFGEMAEALLLASTRVEPRRLLDVGFEFEDPDLEAALEGLVGRGA